MKRKKSILFWKEKLFSLKRKKPFIFHIFQRTISTRKEKFRFFWKKQFLLKKKEVLIFLLGQHQKIIFLREQFKKIENSKRKPNFLKKTYFQICKDNFRKRFSYIFVRAFSKWRKHFTFFWKENRLYFCEGISSSDIRKVMLKKLYFSKRKTIFMFWWGQLQKEKTNSKRKTNFSKKKRKRTNFLFQNKNIFIQKRKKKLFQKKKYFLQRINILFSPYKKKKAGENINKIFIFF